MKIENLRTEQNGDTARVVATVTWEDCDRPTQELYFETSEEFASDLTCDPHAFLVGCVVPALHFGEERILLDAEICPRLKNGLRVAMSWLQLWYYGDKRKLPRLETKTMASVDISKQGKEAGFFFSGGVDSYATFCANRLDFPKTHPGYIKNGLLIYGLEMDDPRAFDHVVSSLSDVSQDADIRLMLVKSNVYLVYRDEDAKQHFDFWIKKFQAAALTSVAHAFSRRIGSISIPASDDIPSMAYVKRTEFVPYGTHPILDYNYSSSNLLVHHATPELSRLDRVRLIADWDVALQNLRVCNRFREYEPGKLNCGKCEKCVRTMLELLVAGALHKTRAFPSNDVSAALVDSVVKFEPLIPGSYDADVHYLELLTPLRKLGRQDLVSVIEKKISEARRDGRSMTGWRKQIRRIRKKLI